MPTPLEKLVYDLHYSVSHRVGICSKSCKDELEWVKNQITNFIEKYPSYYDVTEYDENFGDDKECQCGHPYYRHFDTYDDMSPAGCKYCYGRCETFKEK